MNFYEQLFKFLTEKSKESKCPNHSYINPKLYEELRQKTFEENQRIAREYGLYLMKTPKYQPWSNTHSYLFSLEPCDENGLELSVKNALNNDCLPS